VQPSRWGILKGFFRAAKNLTHSAAAQASQDLGLNILDLPNETKLIKALLRTYAAVIGLKLLHATGGNLVAGAVLGTAISLPATLIAAGAYGTYYGAATVIAACYSGSLATLGIGAASILGGAIALEYHDVTIGSLFSKKIAAIASKIGLPTKKPLGVVEKYDVPTEWQQATTSGVTSFLDTIKISALFKRIFKV
jgi:hypothetical protein